MTKKIWELPELAAITDDDIFLVANDPGGAPTTRYITSANLGYASKAAANVFTVAPQQVTINSAGNKGFIIKAANSQSANLQEWQDSSGTVLAYIDANGYVHSPILRSPTSMMLYTPLDITLNGSQVRITTDGDAATPAVGWDNDRDTGLFRQGANSLGIAAGGVEVFRVVAGASAATGLSVTGNAAGSGVTLTAMSSGTDEGLKLQGKGAGAVSIGPASNVGLQGYLYVASNVVQDSVIDGNCYWRLSSSGSSNNVHWRTYSTGMLGWSSNSSVAGTIDLALGRNAASALEVNNGTAGQWGSLLCGTRDTSTTAVTNGLTIGHQASSGTPAAGMGSALRLRVNSSTTADQDAGRVYAAWADATHATRSADLVLTAYYTSTEREGVRIRGGSSDAQIGLYGATPVSRATTGIAEASFTENAGGTAVNVDSTFGGYTLQQVVQALQNIGVLT